MRTDTEKLALTFRMIREEFGEATQEEAIQHARLAVAAMLLKKVEAKIGRPALSPS